MSEVDGPMESEKLKQKRTDSKEPRQTITRGTAIPRDHQKLRHDFEEVMGRYAKTNYQIKKIQDKFKNLGSSTGQTSQS